MHAECDSEGFSFTNISLDYTIGIAVHINPNVSFRHHFEPQCPLDHHMRDTVEGVLNVEN